MNTGLQDAFNLAWKLALVIQDKSKESILDTYTSERVEIAKNAIQSTDKVFTWVTSQHIIIKLFRVYILPVILILILPFLKRQRGIRHFIFSKISEVGIHYRGSPLSFHASLGNFRSYAPEPGDRLPYIVYKESGISVNIQEKANPKGFHLFILTKTISFYEIILVAEKYAHLITMETISYSPETGNLFKKLGLEDGGFFLVRPDMYIAYRSAKPEASHFKRYLQRFLIG